MGFFSVAKTVTRKVVTAPKAYVIPRVVRKNGKKLFNYDDRVESLYCPRCGESYLKLLEPGSTPERVKEAAFYMLDDIPYDNLVYWACPECEFGFEANTHGGKPKDTIEQVRDFIRESSAEVLIDNVMSDEDIEERINSHMRASRLYFFLTFLLVVFMLVGLFKGALLFVFAILIFIATVALLALKWSYRAWQLRTNSLYAENAKEQFLSWLTSTNPFKTP